MSAESREEPPKGSGAASETPPAPPAEDWATRYKYLLADFENYRRRSERERETITRQSRAAMLRELLPILEAFRTAREALNHLPASDPVRKGLELLDREWMTFLKHEGVEPVVSIGHPFRADEAEAVGDTPANEQHPDGTVAEIVQQGYRFYGGLLRPAKVIVARAPPSAPSTSVEPTPMENDEES
jgi:molecular chaperone GrpE